MKIRLFFIIFLFCGGAVYAQNQLHTNIDQTHRGYEVNVPTSFGTTAPSAVSPATPPAATSAPSTQPAAQSAVPSAVANTNRTPSESAFASSNTPKAQWHGKYLINLGLGYHNTGDVEYGYNFYMPANPLISLSFTAYFTQYFGLGAGFSYTNNTSREKHIGVDRAEMSYTTVSPNIYFAARYPMLIYNWLEPYANLGFAYHMNEFEYKYKIGGGSTSKRTADGNNIGILGEFGMRAYAIETLQAGFGLRYIYNRQDVDGAGFVDLSGIAFMITLGVLL